MPPTTEGVDKMGLDDVRDALAKAMGWHFSIYRELGPIGWIDANGFLHAVNHPIPLTLDAAAEVMPEGWDEFTVEREDDGNWKATANKGWLSGDWEFSLGAWGSTEIEARFRLALKCRIAMGDAQ